MRLKSLYIRDYNILQDFEIKFNSNLSVIIGENGCGKSSIIECLAYIFGHLHKYFILNDKTADFIDGYKINYEINGVDVFIESKYEFSTSNTFRPIVKVNGEEKDVSQKREYENFKSYLPTKVVMSYSGITEKLKKLNEHFEKKFIEKIIKQNNPYSLKPLSLPQVNPFVYVKKEFVSYIVLSLFVLNTEKGNDILKKLGIDLYGCTTTIKLKKPSWAKSKKTNDKDSLWGISAKIALDLFKGLNIVGSKTQDGSVNDSQKLSYEFIGALQIRDLFNGEFNLQANQVLSFLDTLLCDDLLESVDIKWKKHYSIEKLSEGEKQLILSVGLSLVLNEKNILFLLDEPDNSLHPKWQQEFISNISKGLNDESMAIVTTHSPSLVSDLNNKNLSLIRNGKLVTKSFNYYGKTVNEILIDYFGLESIRNKNISKKIDDLWSLIRSDNYKSDDFEKQKKELIAIIGNDDPEIMAMNSDILRKEYEENK